MQLTVILGSGAKDTILFGTIGNEVKKEYVTNAHDLQLLEMTFSLDGTLVNYDRGHNVVSGEQIILYVGPEGHVRPLRVR